MRMHTLKIGLSCIALLAASAATAAAQENPASAEAAPTVVCGGQYECVESRPLTPLEARTSLGYPQVSNTQDPARVAARRPTPEGTDEARNATSMR